MKKPFQLPKMNPKEIQELLSDEKICRIAFVGKNFPYIAPFQYVRMNESIYVHFTNYGKKIRLIEKNNKVCLTVEKLNADMSEFKFVAIQGELKKVQEKNERAKAIQMLASVGKEKLSTTFLAAHGFSTKEEWDVISEEKPLVIFKLDKINRILGLRSPIK